MRDDDGLKMRKKRAILILSAVLLTVYIGLYVAFRTAGFYQWCNIAETRHFAQNDPMPPEPFAADFIVAHCTGWEAIASIAPLFKPLAFAEYVCLVKNGPLNPYRQEQLHWNEKKTDPKQRQPTDAAAAALGP